MAVQQLWLASLNTPFPFLLHFQKNKDTYQPAYCFSLKNVVK